MTIYHHLILFFIVSMLSSNFAHAAPGDITTIAGGQTFGVATNATLKSPLDIAFDSLGNFYIADTGNHLVRKVDTAGNITVIAGTNNPGFTSDNIKATDSDLHMPRSVCVDKNGNVYIADEQNHSIRKVDTNGMITTVAGNRNAAYSGDGGLAVEASLNVPAGITVDDAGNLYISDQLNHRIRKVDTNGIITTIAGNGIIDNTGNGGLAAEASVNNPTDTFLHADGNLYISVRHHVRKIDPSGIITTVAGDGFTGSNLGRFQGDNDLAIKATLRSPIDVFVDPTGNLYIADHLNHCIRTVDTNDIITTIAGDGFIEPGTILTGRFSGDGGFAIEASLDSPQGVAVDSFGDVYIADRFNNRIRRVDTNGIIGTVAGGGNNNNISASLAFLNEPWDVFCDAQGNTYIADSEHHQIRKIDPSGIMTTIVGTDFKGSQGDDGPAIEALINDPRGVWKDKSNNLYIADAGNHRIRKVDSSGIITTIAGTGISGYSGDSGSAQLAQLSLPSGLLLDNDNNLYIVDTGNHCIRKIDSSGIITTIAGNGTSGYSGDNGLATDAQLRLPFDIALDQSGNLYIADGSNNRIRKVQKTTQMITTVAGNGEQGFQGDEGAAINASLNRPQGITIDTFGNLYISDTFNHSIRKVDPAGTITTIAGTQIPRLGGDGESATSASLRFPRGLYFNTANDLLIADVGNNRIRKIESIGLNVSTLDPIRADFDNSGKVDFPDFLAFVTAFGSNESSFDFDSNGQVDFPDFLSFVSVFGKEANP